MSPPFVVALPGAERCAKRLADRLSATNGCLRHRRFPDGESHLQIVDDVGASAAVVCAELRDPDPQLASLLFAADALRDLGASGVHLVAPYLPYMRQDARFLAGEAITSRSFARVLGNAFDGLVTVDPHLHRWPSLGALYRIPALALPSAPAIAIWLQANVRRPHLLGPDEESLQWVSEVAALAGCAYSVARKRRRGDRDVALEMPPLDSIAGCTPVLLDDIVSSGRTLAAAAQALRDGGLAPPVCIVVHALFAMDAQQALAAAGVERIVSCNTVTHQSNGIDVGPVLAEGVRMLLGCEAGARDPARPAIQA